jgi:S-formylglutathione hydrolase FrmB
MSALLRCDFFSKAVNIETTMNVILPEDTDDRAFPTLYLLHGYSDNCTAWTRWTAIERYAKQYRLAIVMPEVQKSFYCDFPAMQEGYRYWSFVSEELVEITRRFFRLSHRREDTYVAGLSMGGFGALKCALNRPDVFSAAGSLSGVMPHLDEAATTRGLKEVEMVYGEMSRDADGGNDLFAAAERLAQDPDRPRLYQYCGTEDFLYQSNLRFRDHLRALGYRHTYAESPGGHEWRLWDRYIEQFLKFLKPEKLA